jgi:hypothetical protein
MALQQHTAHLIKKYKQLSTNYEQLRQMVIDMISQMSGTCAPLFLAVWSQEQPASLFCSLSVGIVLVKFLFEHINL